MEPPDIFKHGDQVFVTHAYKTTFAVVTLASKNGRSLILSFNAMLGGYGGWMPVLWSETRFIDLIQSEEVVITRVSDHVG